VVVSADAVYRLDYGDLVADHRRAGAVATMVTTRIAADDAGRYGVVLVADGEVRDYRYKPDEPAGDLVSNEVFVFDPGPVLDELGTLPARNPTMALPTWARNCCPGWWLTAAYASTASRAIGVTSARSMPTGLRTRICSRTHRNSRSMTSAGRSAPRAGTTRVERAVLDDGVEVSRGATAGGPDAVSLLGRRVRVEADATIKAGARFPEED